jgi:hypothetical protein
MKPGSRKTSRAAMAAPPAAGAGAGSGRAAGAGRDSAKGKKKKAKAPRKRAASDVDAGGDVPAAAPASDDDSSDGAAWKDSDDEGVVVDVAATSRLRKLRRTEEEGAVAGGDYEKRLRRRFQQTAVAHTWADLSARRDGVDDAATMHAGALVVAPSVLGRDVLDVTRQRDLNHAEPCKAVVQCLEFHPSGQLALTAGFDKRIRLFQVRARARACVCCCCGDVVPERRCEGV